MEAAVSIQFLPHAIVEMTVGDGADGSSDVVCLTHAALRQQAGGDLFFIDRLYIGDPVGADDAGLDLKHEDAFGSKGGRDRFGRTSNDRLWRCNNRRG